MAYPQQPGTVYGPAHPPRDSDLTRFAPSAFGMLGALMLIAGSVMPWARIYSPFGTIDVAGTDGDGVFTLIAGVALAAGFVLNAFARSFWLRIAQLFAAVLALGLAGYELVNVATGLDEAGSELARASVGSGLYVLVLGALIIFGAAVAHPFVRPPSRGSGRA